MAMLCVCSSVAVCNWFCATKRLLRNLTKMGMNIRFCLSMWLYMVFMLAFNGLLDGWTM